MEHLRKKVLNAIHLLQNSSSIKQITKFIQKSTSDSNLFSAVEQICLEGFLLTYFILSCCKDCTTTTTTTTT
ncbi:uncharacterized protein LOC119689292 isoform X2 [Teleopsis dalmanni]|uniref:uncharacterized protein LOC119689292 isoform X2 n=1 Tax=Teleopsis dalmanni TaxID=139649 RepID=UPI0018CC95BA|nr:uncharacterized protein LOC119689292 isoform X2 [Teleopsis dalmanni]